MFSVSFVPDWKRYLEYGIETPQWLIALLIQDTRRSQSAISLKCEHTGRIGSKETKIDNNMNLLFVCSKNKLRSPTAEQVFSEYQGIEAIGCGLNSDSETNLSGDLIQWADVIFVMEKIHKSKVTQKYQRLLKNKRVICLNIPDRYQYMQPELVKILQAKVTQYL